MNFQFYRCSLQTRLKHADTALQEAHVSIASVKCLQPTEHDQCWLVFLNARYNRNYQLIVLRQILVSHW